MNRSRLTFISLAGFLGSLAFGQANLSSQIESPAPSPGGWTRHHHRIVETDTPPKIDGVLDDPCWKTAYHGSGFCRFVGTDAVKEQTEFWMCADKNNLYVALHCLESHPESVVAKETQRNGSLQQDDRIGVALDSQFTRRNASMFWVSARGTQAQELEGGTAENQAWQGDWTAATKKVADGWIVEMAIPFRMLRYPKHCHSFGIIIARKKASETNFMLWPYTPPQADNGRIAEFMDDLDGINPPDFAPRPTILPYALGTAGDGTSARFGLDVKYPFSTTLTGVATIKPDFQTVEGAVSDLSFSYTQKFIQDHRPFFAEGSDFIQDPFLFYSPAITDVDYGMKVTGKQGPTTIGILSTTAHTGSQQQAELATFDQEVGKYSSFGGSFVQNRQPGNFGQLGQVRGTYGWSTGTQQVSIFGNSTQTWLGSGKGGESDYLQVQWRSGMGKVNGNIYANRVDPDFHNPLGLQGDVDLKGAGFNLFTYNNYDKGKLESRSFSISGEDSSHTNNTFFHNSLQIGGEYDMRNGYSYSVNVSAGNRDSFHDELLALNFGWNNKSLLSRGSIEVDNGKREGLRYRFLALGQGIPINQKLSLALSAGQQLLGNDIQNQAILSGTYRLDSLETVGGRLVAQGGDTNVYLSYGRRTRKGNDLFILVGDPNSPTFRHAVSIKMVWSL